MLGKNVTFNLTFCSLPPEIVERIQFEDDLVTLCTLLALSDHHLPQLHHYRHSLTFTLAVQTPLHPHLFYCLSINGLLAASKGFVLGPVSFSTL